MIIELWRHGPTSGTLSNRYEGAGTDSPLDVSETLEALRSSTPPAFSPDHVFTSDMRRCVETARLVYPSATLLARPNLREMHFGVFEGRGFMDMERDAAYRRWVDSGCEDVCPGGEGRAGFTRRVVGELLAIFERESACGEGRVAIVAHGGVARVALSALARPPIPYFSADTPPAARWLLDWGGDSLRVLAAPGQEAPCTSS